MKRASFLAIILIGVFLARCVFAEYVPDYMKEKNRIRQWNLSAAAGYGLLYVNDTGKDRHGAGLRLLAAYNFTGNWGVQLEGRQGIYDGDSESEQGIYSQSSVSAAARYTFQIKDWLQPYVFLGLGWARTELDRELDAVFVEHSMIIETGGGLMFAIKPNIFLGIESALAPVFLGSDNISGSLFFQTLVSADLRF